MAGARNWVLTCMCSERLRSSHACAAIDSKGKALGPRHVSRRGVTTGVGVLASGRFGCGCESDLWEVGRAEIELFGCGVSATEIAVLGSGVDVSGGPRAYRL